LPRCHHLKKNQKQPTLNTVRAHTQKQSKRIVTKQTTVQTPFFTVGCTWPLRCIDGTVIGRQCQPDYVVVGALGRWGTLSVLTMSEDAGRFVYSFSAQGKAVSSYFKANVIAPLTHLLTPSPPKKEL
jgi:hypothetical protein